MIFIFFCNIFADIASHVKGLSYHHSISFISYISHVRMVYGLCTNGT